MSLTLRRTLLLALLLLGVLPCVAVSWLSFSRTRSALEGRITQALSVQAQNLQAELDSLLFERFQNAVVWRQSELMQDLRFGDVDKRVSTYLVGLAAGYGDVYQRLLCLDPHGLVLASSRSADIGQLEAAPAPQQLALRSTLAGSPVALYLPADAPLQAAPPLWIETEVAPDPLRPGPPIATLRLALNPQQLNRLLDSAAVGGRQIVVIDAQGRWVAASQGLRAAGPPSPSARQAARALAGASSTQADWAGTAQLLGRGHAQARPGFAGSGWTTLVLQPVDEALAPIAGVARAFWLVLAAVLAATLAAGTWVAARIVGPVLGLTQVTQQYRRSGQLPALPAAPSRIREIDALRQAYTAMIESLAQSRREQVRSAKLAMLGEVAAVMAHEVRTPLGILRSSAQVLLRDKGLSADSRELMGFIESETERLNRLVTALLETARPRPPHFGPCDLNDLAARCAQMQALRQAAEHADAHLQLQLDATDPQLQADTEQLMQATFNLLSNALHAAGPGGQVRLSTTDAGPHIELRCEDSGSGIAPDVAERLFDPFVTGRTGGIGLGLAVVRQVVDAHGGCIHVGRSPLGGAAFSLQLPRQRPQPLTDESPRP
jgi:two-component system sensor histidine kinase HydH